MASNVGRIRMGWFRVAKLIFGAVAERALNFLPAFFVSFWHVFLCGKNATASFLEPKKLIIVNVNINVVVTTNGKRRSIE